MTRYDDVLGDLRAAYDGKVEERASGGRDPAWKDAERAAFLARLRDEQRLTLLEIGAGTGIHGRWFADRGLDVVCTDLSPLMVDHIRAVHGLEAHVADFRALPAVLGGRRFGAVFAMNCLLHVPTADVPDVLGAIDACLERGGLFFWGQYGGTDEEGTRSEDDYEPKRWFVSHRDERIVGLAATTFELLDFRAVDVGWDDHHFQALTLRARPG